LDVRHIFNYRIKFKSRRATTDIQSNDNKYCKCNIYQYLLSKLTNLKSYKKNNLQELLMGMLVDNNYDFIYSTFTQFRNFEYMYEYK